MTSDGENLAPVGPRQWLKGESLGVFIKTDLKRERKIKFCYLRLILLIISKKFEAF
jgi:hypothetical protein